MPPNLLPFLYQTRTILHGARVGARAIRLAHSSSQTGPRDNSIPFDWDDDPNHEFAKETSQQQSTITPSEAEVFKGIFDEISQGRMPAGRKKPSARLANAGAGTLGTTGMADVDGTARSIVDQARVSDFRDKFLKRYPSSLRSAAQVALGLFEVPADEQGGSSYMELKEADAASWAERAMYDRLRSEERSRVERLMDRCATDVELWDLMEREVFSLPKRLGIMMDAPETTKEKKPKKKARAKKAAAAKASETSDVQVSTEAISDRQRMDIHGRLYPHFINFGLKLFDSKFARSSPYAFKILPRVKELGLPSYVLGVSSSFYSRLALLYWTRFADPNSSLNILQEMLSTGLYANDESKAVVETIRDHLHGCTWGAQGPFVMAMMESSPYDATLGQRVEDMLQKVRQSISQERRDSA